jgi:CO dehydrogenase maturation factor
MRVGIVGKGGSGKTTLAALLSRQLAARGARVLAIDADINQHLGSALGLTEDEAAALPAMGANITAIKDYVRGDNPRIRSAEVMTKTTPPGRGSRLLTLDDLGPVVDALTRTVDGVRLLVTGPFAEEDLGVACYHSKVGAAELMLNHLVDGPDEYVVVDMTAGADSFASGMFTRFDLTVLVAEPTLRGVGVYRQYREYAHGFDVPIAVVGNKVEDDDDVAFLRRNIGEDLIACVPSSRFVRAMEKGRKPPIDELEPAAAGVLDTIRAALDRREKDWARFHRQTVEFHLRNASAWANAAIGEDVSAQVDPEFVLDPAIAGSNKESLCLSTSPQP